MAPELDPAFLELPVRLERRAYAPGQMNRPFLVLAATGDAAVNRAITAEARSKGAWANNASDRRDCDFFFPAVIPWALRETGRIIQQCAGRRRQSGR